MSIVKSEDGRKRVTKKKPKEVVGLESFLLGPQAHTSPLRGPATTGMASLKHENERSTSMPSGSADNAMTSDGANRANDNSGKTDLKNRWHLTGKLFGHQNDIQEDVDTTGKENRGDVNLDETDQVPQHVPQHTPQHTPQTPGNPVRVSAQAEEETLESLGPYERHTKLLYETQEDIVLGNDEMEEVFPGLEKEEEKTYCRSATAWSLQEWVKEGEELLNEQHEIFAKIVKKRIELSCNFAALVSVLDERAEALCKRGELFDTKLEKVKELGKEILNLI